MSLEKITIQTTVATDLQKAWDYYTQPEHITQWNFAHESWHCPTANNDLRIGGIYNARMEARDGSIGFNFEAIYTAIIPGESFTYEFGGRVATVIFQQQEGKTLVTISFDPETENPIDMQRMGWQSILDNFKQYTESN